MGEARYMAAIAVGSMVFNIIYWLFSFLRFGTGGLTAQEYGKGDYRECCHVLLRAHSTCLLLALALILMQTPLFYAVMWVIAPGDDLLPTIHTYYSICIWGTFPSLALYAFTGWFVGMQNTKLPMAVSISQNIVNILLSLLFVYGLHMKIEGVALGTLLAQWSGLLVAFIMLRWRYGDIWKGVKVRSAIKLKEMRRFFSVNSILFYRTVFLVAVNLYFIVAGAKGGAEILSVNSVLMQMFILYTYVMDGFAYAAEALCGKYYGANDKPNFTLALKGVWRWAWALTIVFTIVYAIGGETFLDILTDEETVRQTALPYLPWAILIPICGVAAFVWDGVFVGLTDAKGMLWGTFVGAAFFFGINFLPQLSILALRWCSCLASVASRPITGEQSSEFNYQLSIVNYQLSIVNYQLSNHFLWLAFNAYLLMRGITQEIIWRKVWKNKEK